MNLLAFAASHREESLNLKLVTLVTGMARQKGAQVDFAQYRELDLPMYDNSRSTADPLPASLLALSGRLAKVQGVMIAAPEYNWSLPGSLKNILDWLSLITPSPLAGKTAFLMSASPSFKGGALGLMHLQAPLQALEAIVYPRMHMLGQARQAFDGAHLKDAKQTALLENMVDGYITMTRALTSHQGA